MRSSAVLPAGFLSSQPVHEALAVGAIVAVAAAAIGVLVVLRGQSFAAHTLTALGTLGGAAASLFAFPALLGYAGAGYVAALAMSTGRDDRHRERDVTTGLVLGGALGVAALFLYLSTTRRTTTGATTTVLFGSIFSLNGVTLPMVAAICAVCLIVLGGLSRPLLLTSVSPELAAVRGVRVRTLNVVFMLLLASAAALASLAIGTILSTALIIGPAATALRLTRRPGRAMFIAAGIGVFEVWLGITLAYASHDWPPKHSAWPVSFFVAALAVVGYLLSGLRKAGH